MRIVCISDTHAGHDKTVVPDGDMLIHAGDITRHGDLEDVEAFDSWLALLPHPHKIVICGNHDFCFQDHPARARSRLRHATYLEDEAVTVEGITIYGSPWQPWFGGWAFNLAARPGDRREVGARSPTTRKSSSPTARREGVLDRTHRNGELPPGASTCCYRVMELKPRLHVFGHIHEAAGRVDVRRPTTFVNASTQLGKGTGVVFDWEVVRNEG